MLSNGHHHLWHWIIKQYRSVTLSSKGNKCCCGIACPPSGYDRCLPYGESNTPCDLSGSGSGNSKPATWSVFHDVIGDGGDSILPVSGTYSRPLGGNAAFRSGEACKWYNSAGGPIGDPYTPWLEFGDFPVGPDEILTSPVRIIVPEPVSGSGSGPATNYGVYYPVEYVRPKECPTYKRKAYNPLCSHAFSISYPDSNMSGNYTFPECLCVHPGKRCCDEEFQGSQPRPLILYGTLEYCSLGSGTGSSSPAMETIEFQLNWEENEGYWIGTIPDVYTGGDPLREDYSIILACGPSREAVDTKGFRREFDSASTCDQFDPDTPVNQGCSCLTIFTGTQGETGTGTSGNYGVYASGDVQAQVEFDTCICDPLEIVVLNQGLFAGANDCTIGGGSPFNERLTITE